MKQVIGITVGDPAGVGAEVVEGALKKIRGKRICAEFRVIGDFDKLTPGKYTKRGAEIAMESLEKSCAMIKSGEIDAVVNAPVSKLNLASVGFEFPGQTEFYAERLGVGAGNVTMMLASGSFRVALVTAHVSVKEAVGLLSVDRIVEHGSRTLEGLLKMGVERPRLAVAGLNPHAGEGGMFGKEEIEVIAPAIKKLQKRFIVAEVSGPMVPDAVFRAAWKGRWDAVLCMTHDHGLIPLKMVGFEDGINMTLGLPVWRPSPDHGTAIDIAGKGLASSKSMEATLKFVAKALTIRKRD